MTGAPIDASIRGPVQPTRDRGTEIAESRRKLAANPKLVMEPGVVRPVYRFFDGDGLSGQPLGNQYVGYGGLNQLGGAAVQWNHTPAQSLDEEADDGADRDFLQYNAAREKWETVNYTTADLMELDGSIGPADNNVAVYKTAALKWQAQTPGNFRQSLELMRFDSLASPANNSLAKYNSGSSIWEPISEASFISLYKLPQTDGSAPASGEYLVFDPTGSGSWEPHDLALDVDGILNARYLEDSICGIIEVPQNRTYTIWQVLPFNIEVLGTAQSAASGASVITFPPLGVISAGSPVDITVAGASGTEEFLRFQIDYKRLMVEP